MYLMTPGHDTFSNLRNVPFSQIKPLRKLLSATTVFLGACAIALTQSPKAQALEEIKLSYGGFQFGSLSVQDLTTFSSTGQPSTEIQSLLNVINMDSKTAIAILNAQVEVDRNLLEEASQTFIGESLLQLVSTTIKLPSGSDQAWTYIQDALLAAAADNQVSPIEFIQEFDSNSVVVETEKIGPVVERIQEDIAVIQQFITTAFL